MEKRQLEKIAKKPGNQGRCSHAAVEGIKILKGRKKGDLGLPVQKHLLQRIESLYNNKREQ